MKTSSFVSQIFFIEYRMFCKPVGIDTELGRAVSDLLTVLGQKYKNTYHCVRHLSVRAWDVDWSSS